MLLLEAVHSFLGVVGGADDVVAWEPPGLVVQVVLPAGFNQRLAVLLDGLA